ncbi:MAG: hypothetical protein KA375_05510 [Vitreoscilla sp.]|nr:hypothetical protein [Vitreoscilla sp.]MBP6674826.1 hypothetical protein [Vitreoscilla sp.]
MLRACLLVLALLLAPFISLAAEGSRTPMPVIEKATAGTTCVADPATMRRTHMDLLKHQRNDTVRGGVRTGASSLKACINCHASQQTHSVVQAETNFCVSCHSYAAVQIDCFECHSSKPAGAAHTAAAPAVQTVGAK